MLRLFPPKHAEHTSHTHWVHLTDSFIDWAWGSQAVLDAIWRDQDSPNTWGSEVLGDTSLVTATDHRAISITFDLSQVLAPRDRHSWQMQQSRLKASLRG